MEASDKVGILLLLIAFSALVYSFIFDIENGYLKSLVPPFLAIIVINTIIIKRYLRDIFKRKNQ